MAADTQDIQQELDEIVQEARAVLARMDEVKHRFDAVAVQVDDVEHQFTDAKKTIDEHLGKTSASVSDLVQHLHTSASAIDEQALQAYVDAIANVTTHLHGEAQHFKDETDKVLAAIDQSRTVAEQMGDLVGATDHETHDGARHNLQLMHDDLAQFMQQFDGTTHPSITSLDDDLAHLHQQSDSVVQEAHDHIQEVMHQVDTHAHQDLLDPVTAHVNESAERLAQIAQGDIDAGMQQLMDHGRETLENQFKSAFTAVMDKIVHDLDQVEDQIKQAGEHSAIPREAMKPLIEGVEGAFNVLHPVVKVVQEVASAVGVDV